MLITNNTKRLVLFFRASYNDLNEKHQLDAVNKYIFHLCSVSTCFGQNIALNSCYSRHAWLHHPTYVQSLHVSGKTLPETPVTPVTPGYIIPTVFTSTRANYCRAYISLCSPLESSLKFYGLTPYADLYILLIS